MEETRVIYDDWLNAKIAECEAKEEQAIAILDKIERRRVEQTIKEQADKKEDHYV